ncbi:MAG: hypothetical protein H0T76_12505, partial [Nannocystis sp.]
AALARHPGALARHPGALARLVLLLAVPLLAPACHEDLEPDTGDTSTSTGAIDPTPHVTFVGRIDLVELCGVVGAQVVSFRARQVGCEPGPPAPCTLQTDPLLKEWVGDAAMCPGGQTALDLKVDVPHAGRYQVEARTLTDSGGSLGLCFGVDGVEPVAVTAAQVEARAEVVVRAGSGPCSG